MPDPSQAAAALPSLLPAKLLASRHTRLSSSPLRKWQQHRACSQAPAQTTLTSSMTQGRDEIENRPGQADMRLQQRSCTKSWWTAEPWAVLHLQPCFSPLHVPVLGGVRYPKSLLPTTPLGEAKSSFSAWAASACTEAATALGAAKGHQVEKRAQHCSWC